jgi:F-type H+-transporting ATPase subunit epsilon
MTKFLLEIITPQRQVLSEEVDNVIVPTKQGKIGILAHHEPLFSTLTEGEIKITNGNKEYFLAIGGGFMEVTAKKVSILVSSAYHAHELNEEEIKKAQESARSIISGRVKGEELLQAQAILRRSTLELKVARRHRKQRTTFAPQGNNT